MSIDPVVVISRLLHILAAVTLLGGAIFARFALMPAANTIDQDEHSKLKNGVTNRWKFFVHIGIALLIFSGFYNYLVVMRPLHPGDKLYHMLMGIKILLAFVVFFYASALVGRSKGLEKIRNNARFWFVVSITLSVIIVSIGSFLKVRGVPNAPVPPGVPTAQVSG